MEEKSIEIYQIDYDELVTLGKEWASVSTEWHLNKEPLIERLKYYIKEEDIFNYYGEDFYEEYGYEDYNDYINGLIFTKKVYE